jgi:hypothetical protein
MLVEIRSIGIGSSNNLFANRQQIFDNRTITACRKRTLFDSDDYRIDGII